MSSHRSLGRRIGVPGAVVASVALVAALAACSGQASAEDRAPGGSVTIAAHTNGAGTETAVNVGTVDSIAAELPDAVKKRGTLVIGVGALPAGFPPLAFTGDDQKTITGSEPDLGRLVATLFAAEPNIQARHELKRFKMLMEAGEIANPIWHRQ